jgi:hypothetical protein
MGHHKGNDELREDRLDQEEHRQDIRDEVFEETDGDVDDLGSQDERRKEGLGAA